MALFLSKVRFGLLTALLALSAAGLSANPWRASWIAAADSKDTVSQWQLFKWEGNLTKRPRHLTARIAVDSKYWLWVNGRLIVYEGGLKRGPSPEDSYYDELDIAPYINKGINKIEVLTWYYGREGFSHKSSGKAALLFDAQGGGCHILSDESWLSGVVNAYGICPFETPNYRLPESAVCFDGRKGVLMQDVSEPPAGVRLQKSRIVAPEAENALFGKLVRRPIPFFRHSDLREYVSTHFDAATRTLTARLPYNAQVSPYLKIRSSEAGKRIEIKPEELCYNIGPERGVHACYITAGKGVETYEHLPWMNGNEIRYEIPEGVEVIEVKYRESGYDTDIVGSFHCNDSLLNELWKRAARTLYLNLRDTYFDCPDRERAQWWADITFDLQQAFYVLSPTAWAVIPKGLRELARWQRADGTLFSPIPAGNWNQELPCQMLMAVGLMGLYRQCYESGAFSWANEVYDAFHRYLHEVWKPDEDGIVPVRPGEWSWADWGENIDLLLLTNEWYYLALEGERRLALRLGRKADAAEDEAMLQNIRRHFDARFWDGRCYRGNCLTGLPDDRAQALAVVSGLASEDKWPALIETLHQSYFASPGMEMYVQQALFEMGQGTFALERARQKYARMLSYPSQTTLFEFWDINGGSVNHPWGGGMTMILGRYVCGIRPTKPGYRTFDVRPCLAGLTEASAQMATQWGLIKVQLRQEGSELQVRLTVPHGTRARLLVGDEVRHVRPGTHQYRFPLAPS